MGKIIHKNHLKNMLNKRQKKNTIKSNKNMEKKLPKQARDAEILIVVKYNFFIR